MREGKRIINKKKLIIALTVVVTFVIMAVSFWQVGEKAFDQEPKICLDAGHGGSDVGAEIDDRYEKDDNLRLTLAVGKKLEEKGIDVIYTRKDDIFVELADRAAVANKEKATYFLSIHRNSAEAQVSGIEAWVSTSATDAEKIIAESILEEIENVGYGDNRGIKRGYQGDPLKNYHVNAATQMPSCLLEMGFMTTPEDNVLFDEKLDEYAQAIADGIIKGIESAEDD